MLDNRESHRRNAFTLIEVLVVVAIIALLVAILLPSLRQAREQAKRAACGSQLHQIAVGMQSYAVENDSAYPYGLAFPATPFSPPPYGGMNPQCRFTEAGSARWFEGYPAYIALFKYKQLADPKVFYCPAQERLKSGGPTTWPNEPPDLSEALQIGSDAYFQFIIGYSWYADSWMGKDALDPHAVSNFPQWRDYPDNWWAHPLGRSAGVGTYPKKRQVIADRADDPPHTMIVSDIMSDYRGYEDVLPPGTAFNYQWGNKPEDSYNSHGGPFRFVGGNVAYNDGSVTWRKRINCEADFKRSFFAHDGENSFLPLFEHMAVIRADKLAIPNMFGVYNLYW